jgi:hypothetical protein
MENGCRATRFVLSLGATRDTRNAREVPMSMKSAITAWTATGYSSLKLLFLKRYYPYFPSSGPSTSLQRLIRARSCQPSR